MALVNRARTWGLLILVNVFWAAQFPAYRVVSETVGVAALNFWTFLIAATVMLPAMWLRPHQRRSIKFWESADLLRFGVLAALGLLPPSIVMAWGIAHSTASNAALLSLTIPVLMVLMGVLMLHERPGPHVFVSLFFAVVGMMLMSWEDIIRGNFSNSALAGNIAIFLSGSGAAFYNAACKKLLARFSESEVLFYGYVIAMLMCAALSIFVDEVPFYRVAGWSRDAWVSITVLGAIVWGGAMLLWMWLLRQLDLGQISVSVYLLPVFGLIVSALTLNDRVGRWQIVGAVLVLASTYVSSTRNDRSRASADGHRKPPAESRR